jgi:hypothetical protein
MRGASGCLALPAQDFFRKVWRAGSGYLSGQSMREDKLRLGKIEKSPLDLNGIALRSSYGTFAQLNRFEHAMENPSIQTEDLKRNRTPLCHRLELAHDEFVDRIGN